MDGDRERQKGRRMLISRVGTKGLGRVSRDVGGWEKRSRGGVTGRFPGVPKAGSVWLLRKGQVKGKPLT